MEIIFDNFQQFCEFCSIGKFQGEGTFLFYYHMDLSRLKKEFIMFYLEIYTLDIHNRPDDYSLGHRGNNFPQMNYISYCEK